MEAPTGVAETYFTPAGDVSVGEYGDDVESVIERSKSHWTQVDSADAWGESEEDLQEENVRFFQHLKEEIPSNAREKMGFFQDYGESLKVGKKIGEGGQAEIFEGTWIRNEAATQVVVKMFKHGYKLADLHRLWPRGMFHSDFASDFVCGILGATLLDGRLAFVMSRCWGDLRRVLDLRIRKHNPPFPFQEAWKIMSNIAHGMKALHSHGILHRDLKASNVLLSLNAWTGDPVDIDYNVCSDERQIGEELYLIADFESSENVLGTGFWRAPEVLRSVEKKGRPASLETIWTEKVDIYSYGMTCYEILTGRMPFSHIKGLKSTDYGIVLEGGRPPLPDYIPEWIQEVVQKCWHSEPSQRPTFNEIINLLHSRQDFEEKWKVTKRFGW
jgi:serine/threonine protein kinase